MTTNLLGKLVHIVQYVKGKQDGYAGKIGRVVAVAHNEAFFRIVVSCPGMGLATFDAADLKVLPRWVNWLTRLAFWRGL